MMSHAMTVEMPARFAALPRCPVRGIPVPWFISWAEGKPEFRVADARKCEVAVLAKKCWVCGDYLGKRLAFLVGPMCAVDRTTAEPPSRRECAEYRVRACPFLSRPAMDRREGGLPSETSCDGEMIRRNPGVSLLWMATSYDIFRDGAGGWLIRLADPFEVKACREGRASTPDEIRESFDYGLPSLRALCRDGREAMALWSGWRVWRARRSGSRRRPHEG